ncbi:hypothetical protein [Sideroxydans sp. CL21]|nr:hypothetical protein [Sideroxydans sp. CL21]
MMAHLSQSLRNDKQSLPLSYKPSSITSYSFGGTATDYLLRYTITNNSIRLEDSFAYQTVRANHTMILWESERILKPAFFSALFDIGKFYLDGRDAANEKSVYSATALAVLEHLYRSEHLPKALSSSISEELLAWIKTIDGESLEHKLAWYTFDAFYQSLGGKSYADDIASLIGLFSKSWHDPSSEIYKARINNVNQSFFNSRLVNGADFDCIIECNGRSVLTDIKTSVKPLTIQHLRQLLSYALLLDPDVDGYDVTDIGFYHSRSASFRFSPIEKAIKDCFRGFTTVAHARKTFLSHINTNAVSSRKELSSPFKLPIPYEDRAEVKYVFTHIHKSEKYVILCYVEKEYSRSFAKEYHPVGMEARLTEFLRTYSDCPHCHTPTSKLVSRCLCNEGGNGEIAAQISIDVYEEVFAPLYEQVKREEKEKRVNQYRYERQLNGERPII